MKKRLICLLMSLTMLLSLVIFALPIDTVYAATSALSPGAVTSMAAGPLHSAVILNDGTMRTFGWNYVGALGDGTTTNRNVPVTLVPPYDTYTWTDVAAGGLIILDIFGNPSGDSHTAAVTTNGRLFTWGSNSSGQIGNNSTTGTSTPFQVVNSNGTPWASVSAGAYHTMAIDTAGNLWGWGGNGQGQLGLGDTNNRLTPTLISTTPTTTFTSVSAGYLFTVALDSQGNLWTWGGGGEGQLCDGTTSNRPIPALISSAVWNEIAAGTYHTLAMDGSGAVWASGGNGQGQLGLGDTNNLSTLTQITSPALTWQLVSAGPMYSLGLASDGSLWSWGGGGEGELGLGDTNNRNIPTQVGTDMDWANIETGGFHALATKSDGSLWAWGWGGQGQLGNGAGANSLVPVLVIPTISITQQPASPPSFIAETSGGTLSVTANITAGASPTTLNYQWYSNTTNSNIGGTPISGATNSTFTSPYDTAGTFYYFVEISSTALNATTTRSNVATVQILPQTWGISINRTGLNIINSATEGYTTADNRSLIITNTGNQPTDAISIDLTGTNAASFAISESTALSGTATTTMSVPSISSGATSSTFYVMPISGLTPGTYTATVTVSGGANITPQSFGLSFTVNVMPVYAISLSESGTHTFAQVVEGYGDQTPLSVTVTNMGNQSTGSLNVLLSGSNASDFTLSTNALSSISPGTPPGTANFTVTPNTALPPGTYTATVTVSTGTASPTAPQSFDVTFTATPIPLYGISLSTSGSYSFPTATMGYPAVAPLDVTITNVSSTSTTGNLTIALSGSNPADFTADPSSVADMAPNATTVFSVVPISGLPEGIYTTTVTVTSDDINVSPQEFNVSFSVQRAATTGPIDLTTLQPGDFGSNNSWTFDGTTLTINDGASVDITGSLGSSQNLFINGTADVAVGSDFINNGTITVSTTGALDINGTLTNNGLINNNGNINIYSGGSLSNNGIIINDTDDSDPSIITGTISISPGGMLVNSGSGSNLVNNGDVDNSGTIINNADAQFSNRNTLTNTDGGVIDNNGNLDTICSGQINNQIGGTINNSSSGSLNFCNDATLINGGVINNDGDFTSTGTIDNFGTINNTATAPLSFTNNGTLNNPGTINNDGIFENNGTINSSGIINNNATIDNNASGSIENNTSGTISNLGGAAINNQGSINNDGMIINMGSILPDDTISGSGIITSSPDFSISHDVVGTLTFPSANVGFTTPPMQTVTINNMGAQPTGALNITLTNPTSGNFTLSTVTLPSIPIGGSAAFDINPNVGLSTGTYTALVTISGNPMLAPISFTTSFTVNPITNGSGSGGSGVGGDDDTVPSQPPETPPDQTQELSITEPPAPPMPLPFTDVTETHWAYSDINCLWQRGIMRGISDTVFDPNGALSRAMLITMLYRLAGEPDVTFTPSFDDVSAERWYSEAVAWAVNYRLSAGVGNNLFAPDTEITREQVVTMLYNYAVFRRLNVTVPASNVGADFLDFGSVSAWAVSAVQWAIHNDLMQGYNNMLNPRDTATRAETAALLSRFIQLFDL